MPGMDFTSIPGIGVDPYFQHEGQTIEAFAPILPILHPLEHGSQSSLCENILERLSIKAAVRIAGVASASPLRCLTV